MKKVSLVLAVVAGCLLSLVGLVAPERVRAGQKGEFVANEAAERLPNIDAIKQQLRQYHACTCTCGCYARDFSGQADKAMAFLEKRAAHRAAQEKLALVLDIDETTLSNWEEMDKVDFTYNSKVFTAWEQEARAPALDGTLKLYRDARRLGVSVFFITGRPEEDRAATEKNLRAAGYDGWQGLSLRGAHRAEQTTAEYKSAERGRIVAQGYRLVLNAGDQWSDLSGQPEAEYSVKYPNPFYFIP